MSVAARAAEGETAARAATVTTIVAWLARNPAALGQHFPAIHGYSAKSKGIADIPTIALVSPDTVKTPQSHFSLLATGHRHELLQEPAGRQHTNSQHTLYFRRSA